MRPDGNDFTSYLLASRTLWSGANAYATVTPFPYIYPLFLCVALWPLAHVPYGLAVASWYALSVAALGVSVSLARPAETGAHPGRWIAAATAVCVALVEVLQNNFVNGQVNTLVLVLSMGFAWLWIKGERSLASVLLGAAIAVKITPAILLLFLARRRAWRGVLESISVAGILAVGLPLVIRGPAVFADYRYYAANFLQDRLADASTVVGHSRGFGAVEVWRQLSGASWALDVLVFGLALAALLAVVDTGRSNRGRTMLTIALYLGASLLITPMSEIHHLIAIAPGVTLLMYRAITDAQSMSQRAILGAVLVVLAGMRYVPFGAFAGVVGTCFLLVLALRDTRTGEPRRV